MRKLVRVKSVEYIDGYTLRLAFTNGKVKVVDLAYIFKKSNAGNYFEPLRDLERFKDVYCDYGTICWPNRFKNLGSEHSDPRDLLWHAVHKFFLWRHRQTSAQKGIRKAIGLPRKAYAVI